MASPRTGGRYSISGRGETLLGQCDDRLKLRLTNWLVKQRQLGDSCPVITGDTINEAKQWKGTKISDRVDLVLRYLEGKAERPGKQIVFYLSIGYFENVQLEDPEIIYLELLAYSGCVGNDELIYFLTELRKDGLIQYGDKFDSRRQSCTLTMDGHKRLEELEKNSTTSSRAFVAMWLDDSMNDVWAHGFKKAIDEAGYEPVRIDEQEHVEKIDDAIIAEIQRARFVVADFTYGESGARGSVYYEAGFAHGLNIPVIFSCRKDLIKKIHFDTRQYNHIEWTEPEELREKLKNRIAAQIGDGPNK